MHPVSFAGNSLKSIFVPYPILATAATWVEALSVTQAVLVSVELSNYPS
jgi:hypothetical protein